MVLVQQPSPCLCVGAGGLLYLGSPLPPAAPPPGPPSCAGFKTRILGKDCPLTDSPGKSSLPGFGAHRSLHIPEDEAKVLFCVMGPVLRLAAFTRELLVRTSTATQPEAPSPWHGAETQKVLGECVP